MEKYILFFVIFSVICFAILATAHPLGHSLEKEVNGYFIDVGYSATDKIYAGEAIRFDFNLWKGNKTDVADFDHVWIRIVPQSKGLDFAGFLYRPEFLLTGMSYTFHEAGQYELTVRFLDKEGKTLAEASFPLAVEKEEADLSGKYMNLAAGVGGLILGFIITLIFRKKLSSQAA